MTQTKLDLYDALLGISKFVDRFYEVTENRDVPLAVPLWLIRQASDGVERKLAQVALAWSDRSGHDPEDDYNLVVSPAQIQRGDECPDEDHHHDGRGLECNDLIRAKVDEKIYDWACQCTAFYGIVSASGSPS